MGLIFTKAFVNKFIFCARIVFGGNKQTMCQASLLTLIVCEKNEIVIHCVFNLKILFCELDSLRAHNMCSIDQQLE